MVQAEMLEALKELGPQCPQGTEVVVIGGAAAILHGWLSRATVDVDVAVAQPGLTTFAARSRRWPSHAGCPRGG